MKPSFACAATSGAQGEIVYHGSLKSESHCDDVAGNTDTPTHSSTMVNSLALCALPGALTELENSGVKLVQWAIDAFECEIPAEFRFEYAASLGLAGLTRAYRDAAYVNVNTIKRVMVIAAEKGHEAIVRLCHDEWGAESVKWVMYIAAEKGRESIVRLCRDEWGVR